MRPLRVTAALVGAALALTSVPATVSATPDRDPVRVALAETMRLDGWPAALVATRDDRGRVRTYAAGVDSLGSSKKARADSQVRIGSSTKPFTAALVMQLKAEGELELDAAVETYLPGVVRHPDVTGHDITVRQLLQHTSGLPDMSDDVAQNLVEWQHRYISPRGSIDLALTGAITNAPGEAFRYSNTNYILAGLIVEAITGRPYAEALQTRILAPLDLEDTYFPEQGEEEIRGAHPHSYFPTGATPLDFTVFDPSWGHAAGAMVSTTTDMTTFFAALAEGRVVPETELAEMQDTIPATGLWEGAEYGLGLIKFELACGDVAWGHGGDVPGTTGRVAATDDGRAAAVVATQNVTTAGGDPRLRGLVEAAICAA